MKTKPNIKIVIHWFIIVPIIFSLIYFLEINPMGFAIIASLFFLTLFFNRTSILQLEGDKLILHKNNLLFISFYKKEFKLSDIDDFDINDTGIVIPGDYFSIIDIGQIALDFFTGYFFYRSRFQIRIKAKNQKDFEIDVNVPKRNLARLNEFILKEIKK